MNLTTILPFTDSQCYQTARRETMTSNMLILDVQCKYFYQSKVIKHKTIYPVLNISPDTHLLLHALQPTLIMNMCWKFEILVHFCFVFSFSLCRSTTTTSECKITRSCFWFLVPTCKMSLLLCCYVRLWCRTCDMKINNASFGSILANVPETSIQIVQHCVSLA